MTFIYDDFANGLWDVTANTLGGVDVLSDNLRLALIDTASYVADSSDLSLADIPGGAVADDQPVTGVTVLARGVNFDPVTFPAVAAGPDLAAVVLYKDTGTPSTSPLMVYADAGTGLPVTPDGTDITVTPDATGIAVL